MSDGGRSFSADELRTIRHDVRSPLMVIAGFAQMLADDRELSREQRRDFATRIEEAAAALRKQLDEALAPPD